MEVIDKENKKGRRQIKIDSCKVMVKKVVS